MRNLSTFISHFTDGFQSANRFLCQIIVPETLLTTPGFLGIIDVLFPSVGKFVDPKFSALRVKDWLMRGLVCTSTRVPSRAFETADQHIYGYEEHFPVHQEFTTLDCNFMMPLVQSDSAMPRFFNYWQNLICHMQSGPEEGCDFGWPADYYATIFLTLYDKKNHPSITYQFDKAYPTTVESMDVNWDSSDEVLELPVEFTYSYYKILPFQPPALIEINIDI